MYMLNKRGECVGLGATGVFWYAKLLLERQMGCQLKFPLVLIKISFANFPLCVLLYVCLLRELNLCSD